MGEQRLYRSNRGRLLLGVCSGLGEYLNIDPNLIRVIWILFAVVVPGGILLYLLTPLFISIRPDEEPASLMSRNQLLAFIFIAIGLILLVSQYHFWDSRWFNLIRIPLDAFLAIIFIVTGLLIFFFGGVRRDPMYFAMEGEKRLFRSEQERKLLGVCGGIAAYFNTDPSLVRLLFVAFTLVSIWLGVILYVILALLMPQQPHTLPEDTEGEPE